MRPFFLYALAAALLLTLASTAFAGDGRNWTMQPPPSWTEEDEVNVAPYFTENGETIGQAPLLVGPLLPGDDRPVDGGEFVDSGRTICLHANSYRAARPQEVVEAVPSCFRFPEAPAPIEPPILHTP